MKRELKIKGLESNIAGAYEYVGEIEERIKRLDKNNLVDSYTIEILKERIVWIFEKVSIWQKEWDSLFNEKLEELAVIRNIEKLSKEEIEEELEEYEKAIETAMQIREVYKAEMEMEYTAYEEEIDYPLLVINQKNIDELALTIKKMEGKKSELLKMRNLRNDDNDDLDVFDDDYRSWRLDELYNDDGSY